MGFRREVFDTVGRFDERLGAGASGCSEDSEMWYRVLAAGSRCRYEPAAVVHHYHRADWNDLARQLRDYTRGHVVALFVQYWNHRDWGNLRRVFIALPCYYLWLLKEGCRRGFGPRHRLLPAEFSGWCAGLKAAFGHWREPANGAAPHLYKSPRAAFLRRNPFPKPLLDGFFFREKMRAIHHVAPDEPISRILEIGGGRSGLTALLYPTAQIVNIDLEPGYGSAPCNRRPGTRFICGDATRLPFTDGRFDLVTMFDVIEHIPADGRAMAEALRVLRPGGALLVSTPNENWQFPYYRLLRPICPSEETVMAEWGHVRRSYRLQELEQLVGFPAGRIANFITPMTVLGHDVAFSRLPPRLRTLACALLMPLTGLGYFLYRPKGRGTETASAWRKA
jgi:SAM-dependent methyltransferase